MSAEATYWNGEPCKARRVRVLVGDAGRFPRYWARELVGQWRDAVEIHYGGQVFFIDDEEGEGWDKVTTGRGSPRYPSADIDIDGTPQNREPVSTS